MDYFIDVLTTFLDLERGSCLYFRKYLNLCSEDEQRSYGLERHEGEKLMTEFSVLG